MLDLQIGYEVACETQERIRREVESCRQKKVEGPVDDREILNYHFSVASLIKAFRVISEKLQHSSSA